VKNSLQCAEQKPDMDHSKVSFP